MKVRYNGGTDSYYGGTQNTSNLVKGQVYNVIRMIVLRSETRLILEGVDGEFNSVWFDEVPSDDKTYMAYSDEVPEVGKPMNCIRLDLSNDSDGFVECITSPVQKVSKVYDKDDHPLYRVTTRNSVYMLTIYRGQSTVVNTI